MIKWLGSELPLRVKARTGLSFKFNLINIFGYWMAINIIKGFLNFLVTYEKDLFTELAYEKVIDL